MDKEKIISYVMETPGNTNPNVLRSLLDGEASNNKFIVTITPTEQDFSGTMDKTSEEITAAYEAGQEIIFNVVGFPGFDHVYIPAAWCTYATDHTNCAACATLVDVLNGLQIVIVTSDSSGNSNYFTSIYSLTPAT